MKRVVAERQHIEELLARSSVYHALSMLLRYPDATLAKWLVAREHHRLPEVLERLGADGRLSEQARRLLNVLDAQTLPDLVRQHERTFGHAVQSAAPPYELEYGEEHSHRQPQELSDIAAFYQAFGLRISAAAHERVDHVGAECEFLHYLWYKQACAADEDAEEHARVCEDAARRFLADHLGRWGPAFALRLSRVTTGDLLAVVGDVLLGWLSQECARMGVPLGLCDLPLRSPKEQDEGCAACLRM
ncbi:MAG: molecular chaperone TorD family protein [Candidatus Omnitrophica bacterium]|nr:molecular chaperone TorD family protein [Candidatus Omnitrophota bacterium]